jgi:hypothetical protein
MCQTVARSLGRTIALRLSLIYHFPADESGEYANVLHVLEACMRFVALVALNPYLLVCLARWSLCFKRVPLTDSCREA